MICRIINKWNKHILYKTRFAIYTGWARTTRIKNIVNNRWVKIDRHYHYLGLQGGIERRDRHFVPRVTIRFPFQLDYFFETPIYILSYKVLSYSFNHSPTYMLSSSNFFHINITNNIHLHIYTVLYIFNLFWYHSVHQYIFSRYR